MFTFTALAAGTYRVRMIQLTGWNWTAPTSGYYEVAVTSGKTTTTTLSLTNGQTVADKNFANT